MNKILHHVNNGLCNSDDIAKPIFKITSNNRDSVRGILDLLKPHR